MSRRKAAPPPAADFPKLAKPAQRALQSAGLHQLEQLTQLSEAELLQLHGMGISAVSQLRQALKERGLSLRADRQTRGGLMNKTIRAHLDNIRSDDGQLQNNAYTELMKITEAPVSWAYEAWDELLAGLRHKDNHVRAISAQLLANLARSDPKGRMLKDFEALLAVTKDERFVTARHCLQSLWKVGLGGRNQQDLVLEGLARRFEECAAEKNGTLIRYDIIQGLRNLYNATTREQVKTTALALIETETDLKYRKKYASIWRK
jgi:hypothetical protein